MMVHYVICGCGCGCEADGEWHFEEIRCACKELGCPCVIDQPGQGTEAN